MTKIFRLKEHLPILFRKTESGWEYNSEGEWHRSLQTETEILAFTKPLPTEAEQPILTFTKPVDPTIRCHNWSQMVVYSKLGDIWHYSIDHGINWYCSIKTNEDVLNSCNEEECKHGNIYYSTSSDNYYCSLCRQGMGINLYSAFTTLKFIQKKAELNDTCKKYVEQSLALIQPYPNVVNSSVEASYFNGPW